MDGERGDLRRRTHPSCLALNNTESCAGCRAKLSSSTQPKLLPCLHMMCKVCSVNISEDKHAKACPVCGQSFSPSEVTDCFIFEDSAPKCGGCDESALSGWCKECEEALCSDCVSAHQRVKVTRNHTVIPQEPQSGLSTSLRCTSHKQERLRFFCVTCDQLTCRDCQLIDHRNHSFLLLEEAVVSQRDQLLKLLSSIREDKSNVRARLQDLDRRLNDLKDLKASSEKQVQNALRFLYTSLVLQCRKLSKELEGLCDAEENSLKVMETNLKKLEDSQDYIAAFIHKILSSEGQCVLRHKVQIEKWTQRMQSQKKLLPDSVIQLSFVLNQDMSNIIKNFGSFKVTRVPLTARRKYNKGDKRKNTLNEEDKFLSGLNLEPGATLSVSDTTFIQATTHSVSQAASDLPQCGQSGSGSPKPVQTSQGLKDTMSHASSSSSSHSLQTFQSNTPQYVVAQAGKHLAQSVSSQPFQSNTPQYVVAQAGKHLAQSVSSQPFQSNTPQYVVAQAGKHLAQSVSSQPFQSNTPQYVVAQAGKHLAQSVSTQPSQQSKQVLKSLSNLLQSTSPLQSSSAGHGQTVLNISSNLPQYKIVMPQVVVSQSQSGVVVHAAAPLGPASCPSSALPSFQSSHLNKLTNTQLHSLVSSQSIPFTVAPLVQSIQAMSKSQPSILNSSSCQTQHSVPQSQPVSGQSFSSQVASSNKSLPYSQDVPDTHSVKSQLSLQSSSTQSNQLQCTLFPVANNIASRNSRAAWKFHNFTPVLTINTGATLSHAQQPKIQNLISYRQQSHQMSGNMPQTISLTILPVSSMPQSSIPSLPAAPIPNACSNTDRIESATQTIQTPRCELTVKALADSVGEGQVSECSRVSPYPEEADSNLPTSTVPEKDTKAEELQAVHQAQDPVFTSSVKDCPTVQSLLTENELPQKSRSTLSSTGRRSDKDWLIGLPSSFREILSSEKTVPAKDDCSKSTFRHASLSNTKPEDDKKTDNSDSEFVEATHESEEGLLLRQDNNNTLAVSLLRLPISGSSQFRILPSSQEAEILLQEIEENQEFQRCLRIPVPPAAVLSSQSCSSECSLQAAVLECAVCLSAGASLQCAECGRDFHPSCHVPAILFDPSAVWVCSLCQDVMDDTDPFSCDRLEEPYLSLSDQRRCEQLLLTLMCENHSYLLYKTKQSTGCVNFNLIVGRLLGKCSPPYRSAAELVSDLWALFEKLSNSKKKNSVLKLQTSFQQRLEVSFGKTLHASLLRPLNSSSQTRAAETDPGREKARKTLKRIKAFLAVNCPVLEKKAHTGNT